MPYVIGEQCIDVMDRSCLAECPVDCIYEGARKMYINPLECVDCGACEQICPIEAITHDSSTPSSGFEFIVDNARFFEEVLPGRTHAIGAPGGAQLVGPVGVDTHLVATYASRL